MTTAQQLERYTLLAVFLLALLSIVGLVALVAQGPAVPGVRVVSAETNDAPSSGNVAGQASRGPINTAFFTYEGFNPDNRAVLFVNTASSTPYYVALSPSGSGTFVYGGRGYGVQAALSVNASNSTMAGLVRIDADADGTLETKLSPGGSFQIYTGTAKE